MDIEITKMSSRGQVVIPQGLRDKLKAREGSVFAVFGSKDTLVLKKIELPDKKRLIDDLERIAKEGRKRAEKLGLKESDVPKIVHRLRGIKD
jgi:AbrB family looped-hinge helix DNA binding protein